MQKNLEVFLEILEHNFPENYMISKNVKQFNQII